MVQGSTDASRATEGKSEVAEHIADAGCAYAHGDCIQWETHWVLDPARTCVRYTGGRHVAAYAASIFPDKRALRPQVMRLGRAALGI